MGLSSAESVNIQITSKLNSSTSVLNADRPSDPSAQIVGYSLSKKLPVGACNLVLNLYSQSGEKGVVVGTVSTAAFLSGGGVLYGADNNPMESVQVVGVVANVMITTPATTGGQTTASVNEGSTLQLGFTCEDASGNLVAVTPGSETFSAQTQTVATVTPTGLVTGVSGGTTKIACVVDNIGASPMTVTVNPPPAITVGWGAITRVVPLTSARSVSISITDAANNVSTASANRQSFASNPSSYNQTLIGSKDLNVGSVSLSVTFYDEANQKGDVVGTYNLACNMSATGALMNPSGSAVGTVDSNPVVARVTIGAPTPISVGQTEQLTFQCFDANNNLLANVAPGSGTFTSSGSILSVSPAGIVTGESAGNQNVTCTVDGVASPAVSFTVVGPPTKPTVWVGFGAITRASGLTSARSCKIVVTDSSNASTSATVDRETYSQNNGAAYAAQMSFDNDIAVGAITITGTWYSATGEQGQVVGNFSATGTMTSSGVLDNTSNSPFGNSSSDPILGNTVITNVQITNSSLNVGPGGTLQLTFQCYDTNNNKINVDPGSATFTTTGTVLSVTPSGIVTGGTASGSQNVTCTVDGVATTVSVHTT